ncbi:LysR family transcriptional regulator [Verticiella sediminum]|uniref:LysR family transcriptional regulator n=1 Tax=Verticiella sediminum TaxID=1247510 RepID=A0A556AB14_9BURK|nr:LysR family transcriptional regulator [Verticiella sediminum]TSH90072.1 LysR family transcriptional regulator [Verticiella sediminum]
MKIEAFQTLGSVLQGGSFAMAAEKMRLTPSAVSMQMKQLENYLGQALFDRSGLQVRPTEFAVEVDAVMRPALARLAALRRGHSALVEGRLRIGMIEGLQPALLPPALAWLAHRHPGLQVVPRRGSSVELTNAVKAGQLQAAVVARPKAGRVSGLRWHVLGKRSLMLLLPPGDPAADVGEAVARLDWIRYDRQTVTGQLAGRVVHRLAPDKRSVVELDNIAAVAAMVSAGMGFSVAQVLDDSLLRRYPMRSLPLGPDAPTFDIALVHRKADEDDRLIGALLEALHVAMAQADA